MLSLFISLKKIVTTQMDDFDVDFALKLSNYTSLKRFIFLICIQIFFLYTTFSVQLSYIAGHFLQSMLE